MIPSPELIKKAQSDFYESAFSSRVGSRPLGEAQELASRLEDTRGIRYVDITHDQNELLELVAGLKQSNRPKILRGYLRTLLDKPDIIPDNISSQVEDLGDQPLNSYPLQPDIFLPLAHLAMEYHVSNSILARFAVNQIYTLQT